MRSLEPLTIGLAYEVIICFTIATIAFWQYCVVNQRLPNLTWVPAVVILFPLIMPGPPRRMLAASVSAGAMSPLALLLRQAAGKVTATADAYVQATVHSAFAVAFAYAGAKLIYGLGREVAAAREYGSYRLVELLGQGGMGEVWRAEHRMLARPAAIKLIRPSIRAGADEGLSGPAPTRTSGGTAIRRELSGNRLPSAIRQLALNANGVCATAARPARRR